MEWLGYRTRQRSREDPRRRGVQFAVPDLVVIDTFAHLRRLSILTIHHQRLQHPLATLPSADFSLHTHRAVWSVYASPDRFLPKPTINCDCYVRRVQHVRGHQQAARPPEGHWVWRQGWRASQGCFPQDRNCTRCQSGTRKGRRVAEGSCAQKVRSHYTVRLLRRWYVMNILGRSLIDVPKVKSVARGPDEDRLVLLKYSDQGAFHPNSMRRLSD